MWMNSQRVRDALSDLQDTLAWHDRALAHMVACADRVRRAEKELEEAKTRVEELNARLADSQATLVAEGFLMEDSVYPG